MPKRSVKDDPIDIDELMSAGNMGGNLSFLEHPPEYWAHLFAHQAAALSQARKPELLNCGVEQGGVVEDQDGKGGQGDAKGIANDRE